jgi:predicted nuclease with RNAse H fold
VKKIPIKGIPDNQFSDKPVFFGFDVAVNRDKGLRCSIRTQQDVWETTLKLKAPIRLKGKYPYVEIPLPTNGMTADFLLSIFEIMPGVAASLSRAVGQAKCVAIDAPPAFATAERRTCETRWHNYIIAEVKPKVGGIFWTPRQRDMDVLFSLYFSGEDRCQLTTEQLTCLGQSLWMLVGFWLHEAFRQVGIRTIEVFPAALRAVCQHIDTSPYSDQLREDFTKWGGTAFDEFMKFKSETNDAAICCFTAYLWSQNKTQELHPGEIVVPLHHGARFNPLTATPATLVALDCTP